MKKLLSLLLALMMVFSLVACGSSSSSSTTADDEEDAVVADAEDEEEAEEPAEDAEEAEEPAEDAEEAEEDVEEATDAEIDETETTIYIYIAASLNSAFEEIIALYNESHPNVTIVTNADSSGTLLTAIEESNGNGCDIFFSAATKQIVALEEDGLMVEDSRVDLLCNALVLITWQGSGTAVTGMDNLSDAASMALADGSVPAGNYTRKALQAMGVLDSELTSNEITTEEVAAALGIEINECGNVSKVAQAVAEGSNEVGTVYKSDAYDYMEYVEIIEEVSTDLTGAIIYPVARVTNAEADDTQNAIADDFMAFLQTDEAMEIFTTYMFVDNRG